MIDKSLTHNDRGKRIQLRHRQDLKDIETDLLKGLPYTDIAHKYNVDRASLTRYKKKYLQRKVNTYAKNKDLREGEYLYSTLERYINNVNDISEACRKALEDPEDSSKIDVNPQAHDIRVTYLDKEGHKHRDTLQDIIDDNGVEALKVEISTPDRVKTLLEASHVMNKHLNLLADLKGMIGNTTINIANQPMFLEFVNTVVEVLSPYPDIKQELIAKIREMSKQPLLAVNDNTQVKNVI